MPPHIVADFARQGLFATVVPEDFGGQLMELPHFLRIVEQLAAIDVTLATFVGINNALGIRPIVRHAGQRTKERYLPALAQGQLLAGLALSEPGAGSNPQAIATTGIPIGGGRWSLRGEKSWIGLGTWAGVINVFARIEDGNHHEFAGFVVSQDAAGLHQGNESLTMGMRAIVQNQIHLRGVEVAEGDRLGQPGQGVEALKDTLQFGRLGIAAICLGAMQRCAQIALRYASARQISTGKLLANPHTQRVLRDMAASIEIVRALVQFMASEVEQRDHLDEAWYVACKIVAPELCWHTVDTTMQLLGGRGYIETNEVARIFRDTRLLRIFEGPTEAMSSHLGTKSMLDATSLIHAFEPIAHAATGDANGTDALSESLRHMLGDVKDHLRAGGRRLGAQRRLMQRIAIPLGEWVAYSMMDTLCRSTGRHALGASLARTRMEHLRATIVGALVQGTSGDSAESPTWEADIAGYSQYIGEIVQTCAGEDTAIDPLLAPHPHRDLYH